jgi:hypothetical protein
MIIRTTQGQQVETAFSVTTTSGTITLDDENIIDLTINLIELMRLANVAANSKTSL